MIASSAEKRVPRVSVIVPNYNGAPWLRGCLVGLSEQTFRDFEVILVDNGSTDGSLGLLSKLFPEVRVIALGHNSGFACAVNVGIRAARGEYAALLNNDTIVRPPWLGALVQALDDSPANIAAVASKMLRMDDPDMVDDAGDSLSWAGAARKIGHGEPAVQFDSPREVFSVSAGAALYKRSFLDEMGGFDEAFFAYLEDVDLGLRGRLCGYRFVLEPAAEVLHKGYGSGIAPGSYVRLVTRNRLMLFAKNIPLSLLMKHLGTLVCGQLYFFLAYRRPFRSLAGYASFVRLIPHVIRERRRMRHLICIDLNMLDQMLTNRSDGSLLRAPLARRLSRWLG